MPAIRRCSTRLAAPCPSRACETRWWMPACCPREGDDTAAARFVENRRVLTPMGMAGITAASWVSVVLPETRCPATAIATLERNQRSQVRRRTGQQRSQVARQRAGIQQSA